MKVFATIMKIVAALAAIAGIVYVIAAYGDKIVAWAKELLAKLGWHCDAPVQATTEDIIDTEEAPVEAPAEDPAEIPVEENAVHAEETDFEG